MYLYLHIFTKTYTTTMYDMMIAEKCLPEVYCSIISTLLVFDQFDVIIETLYYHIDVNT